MPFQSSLFHVLPLFEDDSRRRCRWKRAVSRLAISSTCWSRLVIILPFMPEWKKQNTLYASAHIHIENAYLSERIFLPGVSNNLETPKYASKRPMSLIHPNRTATSRSGAVFSRQEHHEHWSFELVNYSLIRRMRVVSKNINDDWSWTNLFFLYRHGLGFKFGFNTPGSKTKIRKAPF